MALMGLEKNPEEEKKRLFLRAKLQLFVWQCWNCKQAAQVV
jgi:hypothetical protein